MKHFSYVFLLCALQVETTHVPGIIPSSIPTTASCVAPAYTILIISLIIILLSKQSPKPVVVANNVTPQGRNKASSNKPNFVYIKSGNGTPSKSKASVSVGTGSSIPYSTYSTIGIQTDEPLVHKKRSPNTQSTEMQTNTDYTSIPTQTHFANPQANATQTDPLVRSDAGIQTKASSHISIEELTERAKKIDSQLQQKQEELIQLQQQLDVEKAKQQRELTAKDTVNQAVLKALKQGCAKEIAKLNEERQKVATDLSLLKQTQEIEVLKKRIKKIWTQLPQKHEELRKIAIEKSKLKTKPLALSQQQGGSKTKTQYFDISSDTDDIAEEIIKLKNQIIAEQRKLAAKDAVNQSVLKASEQEYAQKIAKLNEEMQKVATDLALLKQTKEEVTSATPTPSRKSTGAQSSITIPTTDIATQTDELPDNTDQIKKLTEELEEAKANLEKLNYTDRLLTSFYEDYWNILSILYNPQNGTTISEIYEKLKCIYNQYNEKIKRIDSLMAEIIPDQYNEKIKRIDSLMAEIIPDQAMPVEFLKPLSKRYDELKQESQHMLQYVQFVEKYCTPYTAAIKFMQDHDTSEPQSISYTESDELRKQMWDVLSSIYNLSTTDFNALTEDNARSLLSQCATIRNNLSDIKKLSKARETIKWCRRFIDLFEGNIPNNHDSLSPKAPCSITTHRLPAISTPPVTPPHHIGRLSPGSSGSELGQALYQSLLQIKSQSRSNTSSPRSDRSSQYLGNITNLSSNNRFSSPTLAERYKRGNLRDTILSSQVQCRPKSPHSSDPIYRTLFPDNTKDIDASQANGALSNNAQDTLQPSKNHTGKNMSHITHHPYRLIAVDKFIVDGNDISNNKKHIIKIDSHEKLTDTSTHYLNDNCNIKIAFTENKDDNGQVIQTWYAQRTQSRKSTDSCDQRPKNETIEYDVDASQVANGTLILTARSTNKSNTAEQSNAQPVSKSVVNTANQVPECNTAEYTTAALSSDTTDTPVTQPSNITYIAQGDSIQITQATLGDIALNTASVSKISSPTKLEEMTIIKTCNEHHIRIVVGFEETKTNTGLTQTWYACKLQGEEPRDDEKCIEKYDVTALETEKGVELKLTARSTNKSTTAEQSNAKPLSESVVDANQAPECTTPVLPYTTDTPVTKPNNVTHTTCISRMGIDGWIKISLPVVIDNSDKYLKENYLWIKGIQKDQKSHIPKNVITTSRMVFKKESKNYTDYTEEELQICIGFVISDDSKVQTWYAYEFDANDHNKCLAEYDVTALETEKGVELKLTTRPNTAT